MLVLYITLFRTLIVEGVWKDRIIRGLLRNLEGRDENLGLSLEGGSCLELCGVCVGPG